LQSEAGPNQNHDTLSENQQKQKWALGVVQVVECLPNSH
jgi:hypothetical protein